MPLILDIYGTSNCVVTAHHLGTSVQTFAEIVSFWYCLLGGGVCLVAVCLTAFNSLRQNGRQFCRRYFQVHFPEWKCLNSDWSFTKFVHKGPINNIPALVQIMAWRRPGDKPLSESMMVSLLTHICVTRPQWVYDLRRPRFIGKEILIINLRMWFEPLLL